MSPVENNDGLDHGFQFWSFGVVNTGRKALEDMEYQTIDRYTRRIHRTGKTFADPKNVTSILTLLARPYQSATDLNPEFQEDFSSTTKRLSRLERMGFLQSRKLGLRRIYWVSRRKGTTALLNALLRFGRYKPPRRNCGRNFVPIRLASHANQRNHLPMCSKGR